ncbi:bifunctional lysylphosphatidylglycerol flippase/synthetase MprF [Paenibacillus sp. 7124]|uniref:Phosphatidylglycerol lysyltransferase n=1 Tax=Paenibacillus apii TaxID=1850370 RepID=A0A6M1PID1_9BACL|nr:bifunctional lysylphosphatidylglycerol flippase/synthetase MprF [Paenibacillus apii]NGM82152.1 bifunctional lysylphosphatidylglycerol flippase/synthetase MprF [Paenibacillus apii]NJJ39287.1 bifunctional lysylphosphatidylglycerol flippase/synthetase MprF [Paenibacillus apii]
MHAHQPRLEQLKLVRLLVSIYRIKAVRVLFPLIIIALVYLEGQHELKGVKLARTLRELRHVPVPDILRMMAAALAAVAVMSAYDFLIRAHFRMKTGVWSTFRYSWIANTFNNLIGFAGLAGVGLRTLLYKKSGVPTAVLTPAIVFLSPLMITGLSLLSWANLFGILPAEELLREHRWLVFAVWGMALYLPFFIMVQRSSLFAKWINRGEGRTPWMTVYASVGSSLLEWLGAGFTFAMIARYMLDGAPFQPMMSLYVIAAIAGILSMAPGGIGAFDLIALLGLQQMGYASERAMAVLVIFRLFYYVVPWLIGLVLAAFEIGQQGIRLLRGTAMETSLNTWQKIWGWPGQYTFLSDLGGWALGKLVLVSGLILLLSAATPELMYRLRFTEELLSLPIMRLSHHLSVVIGFMLVLLSRGISLHVRRAYIGSGILLALGAVFAFAKGFDYEEAIFLLLVAFLLWISRARFYRISAPISRQSLLGWLLLTSFIALSYYLLASYSHRGFFKALQPGEATEWLQQHGHFAYTAAGGLAAAWLLLSLAAVLRPNRRAEALTAPPDMDRLRRYLETESGNALTHMLFTGDKSFYWAQDGKVMLPFARVRDKLVVLGDPLGPKELVNDAISEFRTEADRYGLTVVFYQATPAYLPIYHEQGYRFFKLGEEALVPLDHFTLSGKRNSDLRSVTRRFEREGCTFELAKPPHGVELLQELRSISDEWLRGRAEKGYSLGWFDESYLQLAPLALLRNAEGAVIAFASLAPGYDGGVTVSIDLMRHRLKSPNGTMDFLFISLLEWAKAEGYGRFNLGNAPLSSVGRNPGSLREEKIAHLVFKRGGHWYGFLGLRRYKEKFSPEWEPRYLAYPVSLSLPVLTLDLVRLVSRQPKVRK